jgi:hypothetical protein
MQVLQFLKMVLHFGVRVTLFYKCVGPACQRAAAEKNSSTCVGGHEHSPFPQIQFFFNKEMMTWEMYVHYYDLSGATDCEETFPISHKHQ